MQIYDVIILGAGAAGLMCAQTAAQRGRSVLILDSSNKVGKKILMSGGGRCNFTNLSNESENYLSNNPHFCKSVLNRYTQWDFISLVQKHGIEYEEREHGQLFCVRSAKEILNMLLQECNQVNVEILTHCEIRKVISVDTRTVDDAYGRYRVKTTLGVFESASLVVATGGLSIPTMGASGFGYELAKQFGLQVLPRRAGLVPFTFSDTFRDVCKRLSGLALDVELTTGVTKFRENILFTHRGLSGPVVLQVSNYWQEGDEIFINLLPDIDLVVWLIEQKTTKAKLLLRTLLSQHLSKRLVAELQSLFWFDLANKPMAEIPNNCLLSIANNLQAWQLKPSGTEGYRTAEVTLGGVDTDGLNSKTMECKNQSGLYFIGEVVDVTGHLGGFNFQWAWASGFTAGQFV